MMVALVKMIEALETRSPTNKCEVILELRGNNLDAARSTPVAKILEAQYQCLKILDLSRNGLGVEGGRLIGAALKVSCTLRDLYLSDNGLGAEGAKAVAEGIIGNPKLDLRALYMRRSR